MRIAHLSDPHVNLRFHTAHLHRLRIVLEDALYHRSAEHVVITGDLVSDADERDLIACRKLFEELGIMDPAKLTLVPGNHDLYGGPHLAEDLLAFPGRCSTRDLDKHLKIFVEIFKEAFRATYRLTDAPFPFLKRIGDVALVGVNSVGPFSKMKNPVGSNGAVSDEQQTLVKELANLGEFETAKHRVLLLHHHLFRRKDERDIHAYSTPAGMLARLEQETLKLRGKRALLKTLTKCGFHAALHGHVHFTGDYIRKGITCYNGAGAVFPLVDNGTLGYNLLTLNGIDIQNELVTIPSKRKMLKKGLGMVG